MSGVLTEQPDGLLRRYFLDKYHAGTRPLVFDACQAQGVIWRTLRAGYDVKYWGVDKVQKKGRVTIQSERVLATPGLRYDVIDVDTYGSPWKHWTALLANLTRKPVTVFLTYGSAGGMRDVGNEALRVMGLGKMVDLLPPALRWKLSDHALPHLLALPYQHGLKVVECQEAAAGKNARYFGVHLVPHK